MEKNFQILENKLINGPFSGLILNHFDKLKMALNYKNILFGNNNLNIPTILVAGTKGKGSVCSAIESILRNSGLKTGLFTSPHLISPKERIKINGKSLTNNEYLNIYNNLMENLKKNNLKKPPFFGIQTLMAGITFLNNPIDVAIIECGVGGRFDWTQIFTPQISVITHLEFDHIDTLGSTPDSISWHKSGISKKNIITFTSPQNNNFLIPLKRFVNEEGSNLKIIHPFYTDEMGLKGPTASENSSLAIEVCKEFVKNKNINLNIKEGIKNTDIKGRYQEFNTNDGLKYFLDGAHSSESILNCLNWYKNKINNNFNNNLLLCTTTKKRNPNKLLNPLFNLPFKNIIFIKSYNNENFLLKNTIKVNNLNEAINICKKINPNNILATGSLHLIGDILRYYNFSIE